MSEPIPESIPTSADPRSKRPLKKRQLDTPSSHQAATLNALFSKPDQPISLPPSSSSALTTTVQQHGQPPEIVANVQGSSAGAGSGEFHVYKASRRREYERLRAMDEEVRGEKEGEVWERERRERDERDREVTRRKREKRDRGKKRKGGQGDGDAKAAEGKENGGGKIKARVDLGRDKDVEEEGAPSKSEEEVVGVVIHDDD